MILELVECSVLHRFHRADGATRDRRNILDGQIGDEAQTDDLTLLRGQLGERGDELVISVGNLDHFVLAILDPLVLGASSVAATVIDDAVASNGEDPPSEVVLVAAEASERACDPVEHLTEEIVGIGDTLTAQVAVYRRPQPPVRLTGVHSRTCRTEPRCYLHCSEIFLGPNRFCRRPSDSACEVHRPSPLQRLTGR